MVMLLNHSIRRVRMFIKNFGGALFIPALQLSDYIVYESAFSYMSTDSGYIQYNTERNTEMIADCMLKNLAKPILIFPAY